jgi:hypothetical protein
VSHSAFAHDLFCDLSLGLVFISNANSSRSCVYICKFQFRPIHPPSRRLSDGLRLARPSGLGLNLDLGRRSPPRPTPGPRLDLDLGGASASPDLGLGPTTSQGGGIITLPLASSGYEEQYRRPIWLAPVKK